GLGEAKKGARRGAAGWLRDYRLEDNLARLSRPTPAALAEVLGAKAAARVHRSLEAQPYRGLVIAMPYTPASLAGPRTFAHAARYADFLVDTLLPQLHARAPTRPDAVGIDGVSLGGRTALLVALHRPAAFARVGTLQAAFAPRELPKLRRLAVRAAKAQPRYLLRLLTSTRDPYRDINRKLHALLTDAGFASELRIVPGAHNYAFNRGIGGLSMLLWHRR
ncbi:MAG: alpha/beta hydrolase, partial [Polyangiales bacterium]